MGEKVLSQELEGAQSAIFCPRQRVALAAEVTDKHRDYMCDLRAQRTKWPRGSDPQKLVCELKTTDWRDYLCSV